MSGHAEIWNFSSSVLLQVAQVSALSKQTCIVWLIISAAYYKWENADLILIWKENALPFIHGTK